MKNIYVYYISFIAPLFLLLTLWNSLNSTWALVLLMMYAIVYRTWLDGTRLYKKGLISKKDIWKVSYNGSRINYFKELYLQK
jgi:membrane protease YdiL (CAAX protease family)